MENHLIDKIKKVVIVFLIVISFFYALHLISEKSNIEIKINKIHQEFKGKISRIYSVRNTTPTHMEVIVEGGNKKIQITPNEMLFNYASVGDSLFKPKDENIIFLIKNGKKIEFYFIKISFKTRYSKQFPKDWRNKWPESSEWDIINKINYEN